MRVQSTLTPQPWPWSGPRVLIEEPDAERGEAVAEACRRAGWSVAVCVGPGRGGRCPLSGDGDCATAHGADAVISSLGLETAEAREALAALRTRLPRTPILVEAPAEEIARAAQLVGGCEIVAGEATPAELVERVGRMLERR